MPKDDYLGDSLTLRSSQTAGVITTLNEYQRRALATAVYPPSVGPVYIGLKLAGEAGEVSEKLGKGLRNGSIKIVADNKFGVVTQIDSALVAPLLKELGDVLWYVAALAAELGHTLGDVANGNIDKLTNRVIAGTLVGEGDDR